MLAKATEAEHVFQAKTHEAQVPYHMTPQTKHHLGDVRVV